MNQIIEPSILYWIGIIEKTEIAMSFILIFSGMSLFMLSIGYYTLKDSYSNNEELTTNICKWIKRIIIIFAITTPIAICIPSKSTMIQMLLADKITTENIDKVTDVYDRIITDIDKIVNKDKE